MAIPRYPIETPRLRLRPFRGADLPAMLALYRLPEVLRYLYVGERSVDEIATALNERKGKTSLKVEGDKLILAVELKETGQCIGEVVLIWLSATHKSAEIGFIIHPNFHGKGYAAEATKPLIDFAFDRMDIHRVIGRCDGRNTASARLMEKLGMRREAHLVENEFVKGEWTDELVFALLHREWAANKR
jgi:RimJ/RimL family protein N-acetyltransferase